MFKDKVKVKMTSSAISTDTNTKMSVAGKNSSFKDSIKAYKDASGKSHS